MLIGENHPIGKSNSDRRRFKRIRYAYPVEYQPKDSLKGLGSLSQDIGEGGIRIVVNDFVPLHTQMQVKISLNNEQNQNCLARVAWVTKERFSEHYQLGLEFSDDPANRYVKSQIHQIIAKS